MLRSKKKIVVVLLVLAALASTVAAFVFVDTAVNKNVRIETVFSEDSSFVVVVGASDKKQIENFKELQSLFPKTGTWPVVKVAIVQFLNAQGISYDEDVKPIIDGQWRFGLAVTIQGEIKSLEAFDSQNFDGYVALESDMPENVERILTKYLEKNKPTAKIREKGGVKYWTDGGNMELVRYGNIFFFGKNPKSTPAAIARLESGKGGFEVEDLEVANLGYAYVNMDRVKEAVEEIYDEFGMPQVNDYLGLMEDSLGYWAAEKDGFRLKSFSNLSADTESLKLLGFDPNYKANLADKVNGKGVFLYIEDSKFALVVESAAKSISEEAYEEFLEKLAALGGTDVETIKSIFDSPFAVTVSDLGQLIPGIVVYLQLDESKTEDAKKLIIALDAYLDRVIVEFDKILVGQKLPSGVLKKDVSAINGAAFHKVFVDFSTYPEAQFDYISNLVGFDVSKSKLELYYGVSADNLFVLALYPNFENAYGQDVLAENDNFEESLKSVSGIGSKLNYVNFGLFADTLLRFAKIGVASVEGGQAKIDSYERTFKPFLQTMKFLISTSYFEDEVLWSDAFLKIEKVKEVDL